MGKLISAAVAALFFLLIALMSSFSVHERERTVVTRNGQFSYVATPGLHFKLPFIDSTEDFDIGLRSLTLKGLETFTQDNQHVNVDMVIQYSVPANAIERLFRETKDYEARLTSMAVDRMKISLGNRSVNALPSQRGPAARDVFNMIEKEAERLYGLTIVDVQLTNIDYAKSFRDAIERAAVSKADVERAQNDMERSKVDAERARVEASGRANSDIEKARGEAESRRLGAQALADAIRLQGRAEADNQLGFGQAEATNIRIKGEAEIGNVRLRTEAITRALTANPALTAYEEVYRWNGQRVPQNSFGNAPVPVMPVAPPR